jgi:FixJ family two-component response regulator
MPDFRRQHARIERHRAARQLVAEGNFTPIIFITAVSEEGIRDKAFKAGAVGFLSKPFKEECLINHLDVALKSNNGEGSQR